LKKKKKMKIYKDQLKNLFDEFNQSEKKLGRLLFVYDI